MPELRTGNAQDSSTDDMPALRSGSESEATVTTCSAAFGSESGRQ